MQRDLETRGSASPSSGGTVHPSLTTTKNGRFAAENDDGLSVEPTEPALLDWRTKPSASDESLDNLLSIQEYERQRLAQELHDSAGQLVVALELGLAHLRRVEEDPGHANLILEIEDTVHQIDQEIRSLAFLRYPIELCDRSLYSALQSFALGFGRRTGIRTVFKWVGDRSPLSEALSVAFLRVAQEGLANVHRHSRARSSKVTLKRHADRLDLFITDDGIGFPTEGTSENSRGIGLQGMRHRVEALGGRFSIANLKHGAKISVSVPVVMAG